MHIIQKKILKFLDKTKITNINPSQLARFIDVKHPQQIRHHLEQLVDKDFIKWNQKSGKIELIKQVKFTKSPLIMLPIFGEASAGPAEMVATENLEGFLKISKGVLGISNTKYLFALKVSGDSLNNAQDLNGGPAENGDYVIIDAEYQDPKIGDYVVSIIDDHANLKRFNMDGENIVLMSESKSDIPPIYINPKDFPGYMINGKIIKVFKKPKIKK